MLACRFRRAATAPLAMLCTVAGLAAASPGNALAAAAQAGSGGSRRFSTTVGALVAYPVFFHLQTVRVRGVVQQAGDAVVVTHHDKSVLLVGPPAASFGNAPPVDVEVGGVFVDAGRLAEGDPHLSSADIARLSESRLGKRWPGVGELPLVIADSVQPAEPFPAPSIRALALEPERYLDANVTVSGRFRGRNLYGDQPDAPGRSRWDFVLQIADASVWVVGMRPRGQGFNLDVEARADTGRWLEVAGNVRRHGSLVVLEATALRAAEPAPAPSEPVALVRTVGPPPQVVFSVPTQDETDVPLTTRVRVQFSRDIDAASLKGHIRVGYLEAQAVERGEPQPPSVEFTTRYDSAARVLELHFPASLERFRTLRVELLDGIVSGDGARLAPWTLTFSLGGS